MDDSTLDQLEVALQLSPDNAALLGVFLRACLERGDLQRGLARVADDASDPALRLQGAALCLRAGQFERALRLADAGSAEARLLRARCLAALEQLAEGLALYREAVAENPALEDMELAKRLSASIEEVPAAAGRPRLRVISNERVEELQGHRALEAEREVLTFADIGGLDDLKKTINKKIILPYQKPSLFQRFRKRAGGGILMYGPPGCGKTMLARATAGECKANFFNVAISDVLDMYLGESERKLHALFEQAREKAPAVLFFDEVEALGGRRSNSTEGGGASKLVSQFLSEMDGFAQNNHGVLILAATNVPWSVDAAFRRPGRFDRVLFVPPPDRTARGSLLRMLLDGRPCAADIDFDFLAKQTSGFSGADLRELVESAADEAIEETLASGQERVISNEHLKQALREVRPTTLEWLTTARNYARYANEGGQYDEVMAFLDAHGKGRK
ncbi:MAG: ATP-dependent zinc metalloprotease FtsH [Stenotrophomonas maltophilia]|nr:MAG: ATP-dependent zinc metalloprotease FtsH [Stenotrophomonas maltophilia]